MSNDAEPRGSNDSAEEVKNLTRKTREPEKAPVALPEIQTTPLDFDISTIIGPTVEDRVKKRTSNILKLTEENEKLKAELKAVTDRLDAAERRREELARKEQKTMEERSQ